MKSYSFERTFVRQFDDAIMDLIVRHVMRCWAPSYIVKITNAPVEYHNWREVPARDRWGRFNFWCCKDCKGTYDDYANGGDDAEYRITVSCSNDTIYMNVGERVGSSVVRNIQQLIDQLTEFRKYIGVS